LKSGLVPLFRIAFFVLFMVQFLSEVSDSEQQKRTAYTKDKLL